MEYVEQSIGEKRCTDKYFHKTQHRRWLMLLTTSKTELNTCHNDAHVPNFEQPKCCINASPQCVVHEKMQYLKTIARAGFEREIPVRFWSTRTGKQATSGRGRTIRSYLQEHVVIGFNSFCYDIPLVKAHPLDTYFCLVLLNQDKRSEGCGTQKSRMSYQVVICEYVLLW